MDMQKDSAGSRLNNWGLILQSYSKKEKKNLIREFMQAFGFDKSETEQTINNTPIVILDDLSFGVAVRVKNHFQGFGAVIETTNHDMIKKNCYKVLWPEQPDLSYFDKEIGEEKKEEPKVEAAEEQEKEVPKMPVVKKESLLKTVSFEGSDEREVSQKKADSYLQAIKNAVKKEGKTAPISKEASVDSEAGKKKEALVGKGEEVKDLSSESSLSNKSWEERTRELASKLKKIEGEKENVGDLIEKEKKKIKDEYKSKPSVKEQKIEEAEKEEVEVFEAKNVSADDGKEENADLMKRVKELEERIAEKDTLLAEKKSSIDYDEEENGKKIDSLENNIIEKDSLLKKNEQEIARLQDHEKDLTVKIDENDKKIADKDACLKSKEQEVISVRNKEKEYVKKAESLDKTLIEMGDALKTRDEALAKRDEALISLENQIESLVNKANSLESLKDEHVKLIRQFESLRQISEEKNSEMELQYKKLDEEYRRYRSKADKKSAASARELVEWVHKMEIMQKSLQKLGKFVGTDEESIEPAQKTGPSSGFPRSKRLSK